MKTNRSVSNGFTLLELLISLTIMGVILVIVFGALRIGARAWEKGEADVEAHQRERVVLNLVRRQISSVCAREIAKEAEEEPSFFMGRGDDRTLAFLSRLSAVPTNRSGVVYVNYVIKPAEEEGQQLALYEQDVVSMGPGDLSEEPSDEAYHVLIAKAYYIGFEYLMRSEEIEGSFDWRECWEPDSKGTFPKAVKLTFQRDKASPPLHVIAPIHPEVSHEKKT